MIDKSQYSDVFCQIVEEEKFMALEKVIFSCSIFATLPESLEEFKAKVIKREQEQSTDIGHGVAIAHGKVSGINNTKIALGFSNKGILFKEGSSLVHLIFVIASPLSNDVDYLKSVAALLSWVHDPDFRAKLENFDDSKEDRMFLDMLKSQNYYIRKDF